MEFTLLFCVDIMHQKRDEVAGEEERQIDREVGKEERGDEEGNSTEKDGDEEEEDGDEEEENGDKEEEEDGKEEEVGEEEGKAEGIKNIYFIKYKFFIFYILYFYKEKINK